LKTPRKIAVFSALILVLGLPQGRHVWAQSPYVYSDSDLLALASAHSASERHHLPLGDGHYALDAPRKGYIYLCHLPRSDEGGAKGQGPWISGSTWSPDEKTFVSGAKSWGEAVFSMDRAQGQRVFSGNGLPINHTTGTFPIQSSDNAFRYDRNPNRISQQALSESVSLTPHYTDPPYCMGMEVGVMLTGVPLFNGFDAGLRDAAAHEIQDSCSGHPQQNGKYHYHSLSACIKYADIHTVLGYALDGFPITGGEIAAGKNLMTSDLDVCHGLVSEIKLDGVNTISYHYVMTPDFPYSVSCFRAPGGRIDPAGGEKMRLGNRDSPPSGRRPPPEAVNACDGSVTGGSCGFISPRGDRVEGACSPIGGSSLACVPGR